MRMDGALPSLQQRAGRFVARVYERELLKAATMIFLVVIFLSQSGAEGRTMFVAVLLPLAGIGLLSAGRRELANSFVLWACLAYMAALIVASAVQPDASYQGIWRELRLAAVIAAWLLILASLVACHPHFVRQLFLLVGIAVAICAALNIVLYFQSVAPAGAFHIHTYRLKSSIGMAAYANSTNISATYAVFLIGTLATVARAELSKPARIALALAAAVLLVAVALTQSRSALVGAAAGVAVLALTAKSRSLLRGAIAVLVAAVCFLAIPAVREVLFARGSGHRFEVWAKFWALIRERPIFGYGASSPAGVSLDNGTFLDQAHNLVLSGWFRGGVSAAVAMALILAGGIYWSWRYWRATREVAPLCVIVTVAAAGTFDYQLLMTYPNWPWVTLWLPFGLAAGAEMAWRNRERRAAAVVPPQPEGTVAAGRTSPEPPQALSRIDAR
jgi:O-antigen ligase